MMKYIDVLVDEPFDKSLKSITIPSNLIYIGDEAFKGCDNLKEVKIMPNTEVSKNAFPRETKILR